MKTFTAIPFNGKMLETDDIHEAMRHIIAQFPRNKIFFNTVAAFGISYSAYVDNTEGADQTNYSLEFMVGRIVYTDEFESNPKVQERVEKYKELFKTEWINS